MEQLYNAQDKKNSAFDKKMRKEYHRLEESIKKEIASYYARYGKDDVIEYRKLVLALSPVERDLLYKDTDAFVKKYPQYAHLMPVRESIYKLNRLEGMQLSIRMQMVELGAFEQAGFEKLLKEAYENGYLSTMKGLDNAPSFFSLNNIALRQTINEKWINSANFSDRIWTNKEKLINTLNTEIRDAIIRGDDYKKMSKILQHRLEVGANDSLRLIATESSFVMNQANKQAFMDSGIKRYEISAIMDKKTSPTCRGLDGRQFEFNGAKAGMNFPPFHAFCRTTTIPIENGSILISESKQARNVIPNVNSAMIEDKKLFGYILNKEHKVGGHKALVFEKVLGHNETNGELLRKEVLSNLPNSYAEVRGENNFGKLYTTYIPLGGVTGRNVLVTAGWILTNEALKLTTLLIQDEKKQQKIIELIEKGDEIVD